MKFYRGLVTPMPMGSSAPEPCTLRGDGCPDGAVHRALSNAAAGRTRASPPNLPHTTCPLSFFSTDHSWLTTTEAHTRHQVHDI